MFFCRILLLFTQNPCVCQKKAVPLQRKTMQGMAEKKSKSKVNEAPEVVQLGKSRREKLSNYLIDISKYVMTGVVIASLFKDFSDNRIMIYIGGLFIAFMALCVGLILTDKTKGK